MHIKGTIMEPVFSAVSSVKVRISSLGGFLLPRERCFCRLKVFRRIATC